MSVRSAVSGVQDAAMAAMDRGWPVFPVRGKKPATKNGLHDATTDRGRLHGWWGLNEDFGLAMATGDASGVWALDLDGEEGRAAIRELTAEHGDLPETVASRTGGGGFHLIFQMPDGRGVRNSAGKVAPGVDVRGTGGYIVLPPSPHPSGDRYRWLDGRSPDGLPVAEAPRWLLELVTAGVNGRGGPAPAVEETIPAGQRNETLASLAGTMRRRGMEPPEIEAALQAANGRRCTPPLPEEEVADIASSIGRYAPAPASGNGASPPGEAETTLTDTGNSSRLAELHGDRLQYLPQWGKWIVEEDGFWALDHEDVRVRELAKDVGRRLKQQAADESDTDRSKQLFKWGIRSLSSGRIGAMVNLARGIQGIPLDYTELDADGWLLGVANGVVELETGRLREADPSDLITRRCPVAFDPEAEAPRWEQAMAEWFPDEELRGYVQRVAGAALVGGQQEHRLIIHYGPGANGKGTFTRALQHVLGDYAVVPHLSLLVQTKHSEHDTVLANLFRKRLAVASETERRVKLREASVKNLTGGDRITARRMREDPWEFEPTHSIWLQTNHLPEIAGRDRGIWRRIRVVRWGETFEGKDADPHLDDRLQEEGPGVLRWLVEGCLSWQERGLDEPEAVVRETLDYRESEDTLARFRADTGLAFSPDLEIRAQELQELLQSWAEEEGLDPRTPRQEIGDWLREHGCEKKRPRREIDGERKRVRVWRGVGIPARGHETEQTDALA